MKQQGSENRASIKRAEIGDYSWTFFTPNSFEFRMCFDQAGGDCGKANEAVQVRLISFVSIEGGVLYKDLTRQQGLRLSDC